MLKLVEYVAADMSGQCKDKGGQFEAPLFPNASFSNPGGHAPSTYYCCDEGADPIHDPDKCRVIIFGEFGICLRITWKCTSSGTATGCTSQLAGSQVFTSSN